MAPTTTSSQFFLVVSIISLIACNSANGQLSPNFYATTCSNLQTILSDVMSHTVTREQRMVPLFFTCSSTIASCKVAMDQYCWTTQVASQDLKEQWASISFERERGFESGVYQVFELRRGSSLGYSDRGIFGFQA
ncbi:hypothetical protein Q3G72_009192 [Acer saccharum]|nr:hypothetical protein Q3G72_009192 [Acer saccharum]